MLSRIVLLTSVLSSLFSATVYAQKESVSQFVSGVAYLSAGSSYQHRQYAKVKAEISAMKQCKGDVKMVSDWTEVEIYNQYSEPYFKIKAKFKCMNYEGDFGGRSCYEPVRRCNTGYSNRDCPPCY